MRGGGERSARFGGRNLAVVIGGTSGHFVLAVSFWSYYIIFGEFCNTTEEVACLWKR